MTALSWMEWRLRSVRPGKMAALYDGSWTPSVILNDTLVCIGSLQLDENWCHMIARKYWHTSYHTCQCIVDLLQFVKFCVWHASKHWVALVESWGNNGACVYLYCLSENRRTYMAPGSDMEETTLTDHPELKFVIEDNSKALNSVWQAERRSCNIYRDDITIYRPCWRELTPTRLDLEPYNYRAIIHRWLRCRQLGQ